MRIFFTLLFTSAWIFCFGQAYTVIQYSKNEGLPSSEVYQVYQDKKGFIWFATDNGVVRFDGTEMKIFHVRQGLSDEVVFGFYEDYKNRLWFRTFSGKLSFHEKDSSYTYPHNDALTKLNAMSIIGSITVDTLDQLRFTTLRFDGMMGKITSSGKVETDTLSKYEIAYESTSFGDLVSYRQSLFRKISINGKVYPIRLSNDMCGHLQVLSARDEGKVYFAICKDIFRYDGKTLEHLGTKQHPVISLSLVNDRLWVGYLNGGVEEYTDERLTKGQPLDFLKDLSVTKVFRDHVGGYWFSTLEQGVFHVPDFFIRNYLLKPGDKIQLAATDGEKVLITTTAGSLLYYDTAGHLINTKSFAPPVTGLFISKDHDIIISDANETYVLDPNFKLQKRYSFGLSSIHQDSTGVIWALTGKQIASFTSSGGVIHIKNSDVYCRKLLPFDTLILLVTRNGLSIYSREIKFLRTVEALRDYKISNIYRISKNLLLITTIADGFIVFDWSTGKLQRYAGHDKFIADNVYGVVKTDSILWMGTEKGLVRIAEPALLQGSMRSRFFGRQCGLINNQIYNLVCTGDHIWAFADHGFSVLHHNVLHASHDLEPVFYLKNIKVNGASIHWNQGKLPYDRNNIQFSFGFIDLHGQAMSLRYRLHPDAPWNYTNERSILFNALAPGEYTLELQYSRDKNKWFPAYQSEPWTITPPVWQTWYFQLIVALLVLGIILFYFKSRVNLYRQHQQRLIQSELEAIEQERSRIAKDLHDSVGTDFTAIKMMVNQMLQKYSEPKSDEVENQFQNTLQEIKNIIYGLTPPGLERYGLMTGLQNYIEKLNSTIATRIQLKTFGPEIRDAKFSIAVFRIVQELIANSLKHSGADTISVHINSFEDLLNIVYEDNGRGFAPDEVTKGLGLYNIESRVQSMNGQLRFESGLFGISYSIDIPNKLERTDP